LTLRANTAGGGMGKKRLLKKRMENGNQKKGKTVGERRVLIKLKRINQRKNLLARLLGKKGKN